MLLRPLPLSPLLLRLLARLARAKPAEDNPYLPVAKDDPELDDGERGADDLEEFGLDEGVELPGLKQAVPAGPAGPTAPGPTEGVLREKVASD